MSTPFEPGVPVDPESIPLCVPELGGNEWRYIKECLDTNWISSAGPYVTQFEEKVAAYLGVAHAVAVVNGTAGLHVALLASGIQPDDEVLCPALTFVAPVNAVRYCSAWPVFIDVEPETWQIDTEKVAHFLDRNCTYHNGVLTNRATGRRIKALLPVHILGHPVDVDPLLNLCADYNLALIEDATESIGARYKGRMVGSLGDIAVLSFNGNKLISTGGGGMVVTNDAEAANYVRYLTTQAKDDPVEYVHEEVGFNYRLTNVLAALGVAQLERIEEHIAAKRRIAATYHAHLSDVHGLTLPREAPWAFSVFWMYTLLIDEALYGMDSRSLLRALAERGIQSRPLWHPIHTLKPFMSCQAYQVEVAEDIYRQSLSIPCSVGLGDSDQARVIETIQALAQ
jgi:perosamine synthetase